MSIRSDNFTSSFSVRYTLYLLRVGNFWSTGAELHPEIFSALVPFSKETFVLLVIVNRGCETTGEVIDLRLNKVADVATWLFGKPVQIPLDDIYPFLDILIDAGQAWMIGQCSSGYYNQ